MTKNKTFKRAKVPTYVAIQEYIIYPLMAFAILILPFYLLPFLNKLIVQLCN